MRAFIKSSRAHRWPNYQVMMDRSEPAPPIGPYMRVEAKPMANATASRTRWGRLTVFLLLASIFSISAMAKTGPCFGPSSLTDRVLRLNRIGEPITGQTGASGLVAQPAGNQIILPSPAAVGPAYAVPDLLRPALIFSRSCDLLRSPPRFA